MTLVPAGAAGRCSALSASFISIRPTLHLQQLSDSRDGGPVYEFRPPLPDSRRVTATDDRAARSLTRRAPLGAPERVAGAEGCLGGCLGQSAARPRSPGLA